MIKTNFKKVAASWNFLGIFGNLRGRLYLKTAIPQSGCSQAFFLCAKDDVTY